MIEPHNLLLKPKKQRHATRTIKSYCQPDPALNFEFQAPTPTLKGLTRRVFSKRLAVNLFFAREGIQFQTKALRKEMIDNAAEWRKAKYK